MVLQVSNALSNKGFVINMINLCIGLGLLAKPYAIYSAGWYSIISIAMAFTLVSYASFLIAKAVITVYKIPEETLTDSALVPLLEGISNDETTSDDSFEERQPEDNETSHQSVFEVLAQAALGKFGRFYVVIITVVLLFMMCVSIFIIQSDLCTDIVTLLLPSTATSIPVYLQTHFIFLYIFIGTLPFIFLTQWKQMTVAGIISVISITILVFGVLYVFIYAQFTFSSGYVPSDYFPDDSQQNSAEYAIQKMSGFERVLFSFVVFQTGIGGVTGIPPMVISLRDKSMQNIKRLILISYAIVLLFSVSFGVLGALTYRGNVDVLILNSMAIWPGNSIVVFVSMIKIANLWSSFASLFFYLCDVLEGVFKLTERKYAMRVAVLLVALLVAFMCRSDLAVITATTSSIGTLGSGLLTPLLVYVGMFYSKMSSVSKLWHFALIVFALFTAALVIYTAVNGLSV